MMARLRAVSEIRTMEVIHELAEAHQRAKVARGLAEDHQNGDHQMATRVG